MGVGADGHRPPALVGTAGPPLDKHTAEETLPFPIEPLLRFRQIPIDSIEFIGEVRVLQSGQRV